MIVTYTKAVSSFAFVPCPEPRTDRTGHRSVAVLDGREYLVVSLHSVVLSKSSEHKKIRTELETIQILML